MTALRYPLFLSLLATILLSSCGWWQPSVSWKFTIKPTPKGTVIDMDGVTLLFEGVDALPEGASVGGGGGSLLVQGMGWHKVMVAVSGTTFVADFRQGENTMTFAGHTMVLAERGSKLHVGDEIFDLSQGKRRLIISSDGSVRQERVASVAAR